MGVVSVGGNLIFINEGTSPKTAPLRRSIGRFIADYIGTSERPVPFGGRGNEIAALNWWLDNGSQARAADAPRAAGILRGDPESNNLLITAPAGRGKTALLIRWIDQLKTDRHIVFVPISIRYETSQAVTFYGALAARLAEIVNEDLPEPRSNPAGYYRDKTVDYLQRIEREAIPCLIVIDGLDEARGWHVDTAVLTNNPPDTLRIVISARELAGHSGSRQWLDTLRWKRPQSGATSFRVPPLSREGVADVLLNMGFPLAHLSRDVDVLEELYRLTEHGDPLLLNFYVEDLLEDRENVARLKPEDLQHRKPGFAAYFRSWMDQQRNEWLAAGKKVDEALIDAIFAVLACAHGPLRLADMESLVGLVLSGRPNFSSRTLEPISRFVIGQGREHGYALAHPKLADYLRNDYFEGANILTSVGEAFVAWLSGIVSALNARKRRPEDTPPYALLYCSQHLHALPPETALPFFRGLLENGWRLAWSAYEKGGTVGFTRDIELAAEAFETAHAENPALRLMPGIGIGARVRCALCLSSLRSIGMGMPAELLSELLRSGNISPAQALHLAQLKTDRARGEAAAAIFEYLPDDFRREALATIREIANLEWRAEAIIKVAPHMAGPHRTAALQSVVQTIASIETYQARNMIRKLEAWTKDEPSLGPQLGQILRHLDSLDSLAYQNHLAATTVSEPTSQAASTDVVPPKDRFDRYVGVSAELRRGDISRARLCEIIDDLGSFDEIHVSRIIDAIGNRLDETLASSVLNWLETHPMRLFRGEAIASLSSSLKTDAQFSRALALALKNSDYGLGDTVEKLVARMPQSAFNEAVAQIRNLKDLNKRSAAIWALTARLPLQEILALHVDRQPGTVPYRLEETVRKAASNLPPAEIESLMETLFRSDQNPSMRGRVLEGLIRNLPSDRLAHALPHVATIADSNIVAGTIIDIIVRAPANLLKDCFELIRRVGNFSQRGSVLATLLRRLRETNESILIDDAYRAAFLVGDDLELALARLALARYGVGAPAEKAIGSALDELQNGTAPLSEEARFIYVCAVMLGAERLHDAARTALLDKLPSVISGAPLELRAPLLAISSLGYDGEAAARTLQEAMAAATAIGEQEEGAVFLLAVVSLFQTDPDVLPTLARARQMAEALGDGDSNGEILSLLAFARMLLTGEDAPKIRAAVAEFVVKVITSENRKSADVWSHAIPLTIGPAFAPNDARMLRRDAIDAIEKMSSREDYEERLIASAGIASFVGDDDLTKSLEVWLDAAQQSSRDMVLVSLAVMQGTFVKLLQRRPRLGGNLLAGSPLNRLGGAHAVNETLEAIADVCAWWP